MVIPLSDLNSSSSVVVCYQALRLGAYAVVDVWLFIW